MMCKITVDQLQKDGWKLALVTWKDPCLVVSEPIYPSLLEYYAVGFVKEYNNIIIIVMKLDPRSFPAGENVFLNVPKENVESIIPLDVGNKTTEGESK